MNPLISIIVLGRWSGDGCQTGQRSDVETRRLSPADQLPYCASRPGTSAPCTYPAPHSGADELLRQLRPGCLALQRARTEEPLHGRMRVLQTTDQVRGVQRSRATRLRRSEMQRLPRQEDGRLVGCSAGYLILAYVNHLLKFLECCQSFGFGLINLCIKIYYRLLKFWELFVNLVKLFCFDSFWCFGL